MSVDLWVKECQDAENNPILFYKKQGDIDYVNNLSVSDFCLIIMTKFQKAMFKKFGHNIIAIDGTHGLNNYDFELCSVLVVDNYGEGIPVSFMFSNRKDTNIYKIYFSIIQSNVGVIIPRTFMTDIVTNFYNAWFYVMGPAEHQLYCSWHIDRAWQANLSKIKDSEKRSNVYKSLKVLQQNTEASVFPNCLANTISKLLEDKDTYDFGIYFQNNYGLNYRQWAYCFRRECGINTNMRLESMHKVIKYFYLDGKKVKRLDKSLHVLLKYIRDKSVDGLIKSTKGKYTQHNTTIFKNHQAAATSTFDVQLTENNNKWIINSENNFYCVENISNESCCDLKCNDCNICQHMYTCTCNNFLFSNSICKHIHYIVIKLFNTENNKIELNLDSYNREQEIAFELVEKKEPTKRSIQTIKENICLKMSQSLSKLQNIETDSLDKEVLTQIENHIATIDKLLDIKSSSETFVPIKKNIEPANKKILKQVNFFSTKKKNKVRKNNMKKPTSNEIEIIRKNLKHNIEPYVSTSAAEDHNYTLK